MPESTALRWRVMLSFFVLYIVWGSTYISMQMAVETIPPFVMGAGRFLIAGVILIAWARLRGVAWPTRENWWGASISGGLMFLVATGGVAWAVQYVPSSIAAVMSAMVPLWMVLLNWLFVSHIRPNLLVFIGLALGFGGIVVLVSRGQTVAAADALYLPAMIVLTITPLAWSIGSLYSLRSSLPKSPRMTTGMQLFSGGLMMIVLALATGDFDGFTLSQVSLISLLNFWYLIIVSSVITFMAYVWLIRVVNPARVATYAFVNPVIAFFLGVVLANEPITPRTVIATLVILAGVLIITLYSHRAATVPVYPQAAVLNAASGDNARGL